MIWLSQTAPSNVMNNKPVYAMPQTINAQKPAPNRAAHVFNPFLNDVILLASVHSLNRAASAHIVASLSRALYSGITRASLNAADERALLGLDYVVGHSRSSIVNVNIIRDASSLVNTVWLYAYNNGGGSLT